jgi:hypothetical protein
MTQVDDWPIGFCLVWGGVIGLNAVRSHCGHWFGRPAYGIASDRWDHHRGLPGVDGGHRVGAAPAGGQESRVLLSGREETALVSAGVIQRVGDVRHLGDDVDGDPGVCVWVEEHLGAVVVAGVQPDFSDGLFVGVAAAVQCVDGGGMDTEAVWRRAGGAAFACGGGLFCGDWGGGIFELRVHRDRQVH